MEPAMTAPNAQTAARPETHQPGAEATSPFHAAFGLLQREALRVADETEKALDRSAQELKRAQHEGGRLWEAQMELGQSMSRAWFDGVRRMWNI
jgi:hypothetical protein